MKGPFCPNIHKHTHKFNLKRSLNIGKLTRRVVFVTTVTSVQYLEYSPNLLAYRKEVIHTVL